MGAVETIALVNGLLGIAFQLYKSAEQAGGNLPIPSWDELVDANSLLQSQIDAEK
jgi:hypothetical protein